MKKPPVAAAFDRAEARPVQAGTKCSVCALPEPVLKELNRRLQRNPPIRTTDALAGLAEQGHSLTRNMLSNHRVNKHWERP